jgi:hypothetical protein
MHQEQSGNPARGSVQTNGQHFLSPFRRRRSTGFELGGTNLIELLSPVWNFDFIELNDASRRKKVTLAPSFFFFS